MGLTNQVLEQMGYRRRRDDENISASFSGTFAFQVLGLSVAENCIVEAAGRIAGFDYRLALADSLNAAARRIADDDFADDEAAWVAERNCAPPYVLVHIGPTAMHVMTGDY